MQNKRLLLESGPDRKTVLNIVTINLQPMYSARITLVTYCKRYSIIGISFQREGIKRKFETSLSGVYLVSYTY